ncbi:tRNA pseudouridine synthase-like 1 isoform X2 [Aplysia californica]|uniref:tRNA pseudouridine synthase n=1 Tax=Aplysia californica TaxID=6500 RepID=A0ABM1VWS6_APLCA|nr:tRNA pseudouridine synthase-like 1 isoform X2 [Aplysia californica]
MGRFLIYFSYLGNRFSGLQRQPTHIIKGKKIFTIEGALQSALNALRPANEFRIVLSSRTDKGVHALKNSCHVDLQYPVLETRRVSDDFHSRLRAKGRKYVYRIGHSVWDGSEGDSSDYPGQDGRHGGPDLIPELRKFGWKRRGFLYIPLGDKATALDSHKVKIYRDNVDISKLIEAAEVLSGIHNFASFSSPPKLDEYNPHPVKLLTIGVKRGQPLAHRLQKNVQPRWNDLEFWDVHIHARSFLYKMVRRLVSAMVLHAKNKITLHDLRDILVNPRNDFPFAGQMSMSEAGLFLQDVEYDAKDLEYHGPLTHPQEGNDDITIPIGSEFHNTYVDTATYIDTAEGRT